MKDAWRSTYDAWKLRSDRDDAPGDDPELEEETMNDEGMTAKADVILFDLAALSAKLESLEVMLLKPSQPAYLKALLDESVSQRHRLERMEMLLAQVLGMLAKDEPFNPIPPISTGREAEKAVLLAHGEILARAIRKVS